MNGICNYDCTYCIQSRAYRTGMPEQGVVERIVEGFAALPGVWEIKMSGGEPFAFPGLMKWVVPALVSKTPHRVSILTNLSAPLSVLERFCRRLGGRLSIVSASLHLEYVDLSDFVARAAGLAELMGRFCPGSRLVVNSVLVPGRLSEQRVARSALEAAGLRYFPQLMKVKGGVFPYDVADRALIEELSGGSHDPKAVNRAPSYAGRMCHAGAWYFVVDQTGEAWMCRTGRRFADAEERAASLGNLATGTFALRPHGGLCEYPICPCTVPANRGIVEGVADDPDPVADVEGLRA